MDICGQNQKLACVRIYEVSAKTILETINGISISFSFGFFFF